VVLSSLPLNQGPIEISKYLDISIILILVDTELILIDKPSYSLILIVSSKLMPYILCSKHQLIVHVI